MKTSGLSLIFAGLVGTGMLTGYGYAKQGQVEALANELHATQDSLSRLWGLTRGFVSRWANDTMSGSPHAVVARLMQRDTTPRPPGDTAPPHRVVAFDTIIPPPVCPGPHCPKMVMANQFPPPPEWGRQAH